jgi:thiamine kinase-like enzyme
LKKRISKVVLFKKQIFQSHIQKSRMLGKHKRTNLQQKVRRILHRLHQLVQESSTPPALAFCQLI